MKIFILAFGISYSVFAQMPKMADLGIKSKEFTAKVMTACKNDKSKIKGCESYTELAPLKDCLMKNKEALSPGCKESLSLVK